MGKSSASTTVDETDATPQVEADVTEDAPTTETKEVDFYNIFDGVRGRTDGQYLDMQERVTAEKERIARGVPTEGVNLDDPANLGNLPPGVGTPVVVAAQMVDNSVYSNPSVVHTDPDQWADPVLTTEVPVNDESTISADTTTSLQDELGVANTNGEQVAPEDELV